MEHEIHTRWVLPGSFALGTFLLLCYIAKCMPTKEWVDILVAFLVTVPTAGFSTGLIVHRLANGYSSRSTARELMMKLFANAKSEKEPAPKCSATQSSALWRLDRDVLFSLAALGALEKDEKYPIAKMTEELIANGRRRWTACWASWNSALAIFLGIIVFVLYSLHLQYLDKVNWVKNNGANKLEWVIVLFLLTCSAAFFISRGCQARKDAWQLELGWLLSTARTESWRNFINSQQALIYKGRELEKTKDPSDLIERLKNSTR